MQRKVNAIRAVEVENTWLNVQLYELLLNKGDIISNISNEILKEFKCSMNQIQKGNV